MLIVQARILEVFEAVDFCLGCMLETEILIPQILNNWILALGHYQAFNDALLWILLRPINLGSRLYGAFT